MQFIKPPISTTSLPPGLKYFFTPSNTPSGSKRRVTQDGIELLLTPWKKPHLVVLIPVHQQQMCASRHSVLLMGKALHQAHQRLFISHHALTKICSDHNTAGELYHNFSWSITVNSPLPQPTSSIRSPGFASSRSRMSTVLADE